MANNRKKKTGIDRELEIQSAVMFGKHVSKEKGKVLMAATLLACASPMLLGARMWSLIPEIVESGLIGVDGKDDSIPRWMVAFGLPALMCTLNLIAHGQLLFNQKRMTLPSTHVRLMGRWGFPILSVFFCSGMILQSIGQPPLQMLFVTPCILALMLMMLGAHMFDCPENSAIALKFSFTKSSEGWKAVHRLAGWCWLGAGLFIIVCTMLQILPPIVEMAVILAAAVTPIIYGSVCFSGKE